MTSCPFGNVCFQLGLFGAELKAQQLPGDQALGGGVIFDEKDCLCAVREQMFAVFVHQQKSMGHEQAVLLLSSRPGPAVSPHA